MTISTTATYARASGNGVTTVFNFTFEAFAATDLVVRDILDSTGVPTTKTLTTDYSVALSATAEGGTVTFVTAPAVGHTVDIRSVIPLLQPTSIRNQGPFNPELHEAVFDRLERQIQDTRRIAESAIRFPDYEAARDMSLPALPAVIGKYIALDALGLPIGASGTGNDTALRADLASTTVSNDGARLIGVRRNETGSVARTAFQILNFWRSLDDFGCVGDDSTDNTTNLQKAVDAANAAGGGIVIIPEGVYRCGQVALKSNVFLMGFGYRSCIKAKVNANNYILANTNGAQYVDDVTLDNFRVDGNKTNQASGGGVYLNGRRNVATRLYIHDCHDAGLYVGAPSLGATNTPLAGHHLFADLQFKNCGTSNGWGSIGVTHGSHIRFFNINSFADDGQQTYCFDAEADPGNSMSDIQVANFTGVGGRFFLDGANLGGANFATNFIISNIHVDARGSYSPSDASNMAAFWMRQVKGVFVSNYSLIGHDTRTFVGISIEDAGTTTTFAAEDVHFSNGKFTTISPGCRAGYISKGKNVTFTNHQHDISSTSNGFEFPNSNGVRVGGGSVISNAGAGAVINISATATDVQFDESCKITGTVTVNATAYAAGCEVRRILKGSATYDPPSLADGAGATTTITVTGAALGDFVDQISFSLDVQGITVSGYVSAANTVSVRFQNESGGVLDLASGTLQARVMKAA